MVKWPLEGSNMSLIPDTKITALTTDPQANEHSSEFE